MMKMYVGGLKVFKNMIYIYYNMMIYALFTENNAHTQYLVKANAI